MEKEKEKALAAEAGEAEEARALAEDDDTPVNPEDITLRPEEAVKLGAELERQEEAEERLAEMNEGTAAEQPEEELEIDTENFSKNDLLRMLVRRQYRELRAATEELQPPDLAEILEDMDENNRLVAFRLLRKSVAAEVFSYLDSDVRSDMVEAFSDAELRTALEQMSLDDAADLLEDMPASVVKRVLEKSNKKTRDSLNKLLNYPEDSAGSIMTPEYIRLRRGDTVQQAFATIRRNGENAETVYTCFVVEKSRLVGVVSAKDLMLADFDDTIDDLMDENVICVKVTDDKEYVAREMQRYDFTAMPVVDNEDMLVGIVTIDDAVDVLTEESTEDMQKMAAILPSEDATTYFGTDILEHAKQRIPWLLLLMLSATFTGMVTTRYEGAISVLPLLVSFMPMLMDTAGNCGNQTSTLMVRGLALGEVETGDLLKVIWKELRVSLVVGITLGLVNALRIFIMYTFIFPGQYDNVPAYCLVVTISLVAGVVMAKLVGGMLPLIAKRLGGDPAIMATPFITTIVDAATLIVYFKIATTVFGLTT